MIGQTHLTLETHNVHWQCILDLLYIYCYLCLLNFQSVLSVCVNTVTLHPKTNQNSFTASYVDWIFVDYFYWVINTSFLWTVGIIIQKKTVNAVRKPVWFGLIAAGFSDPTCFSGGCKVTRLVVEDQGLFQGLSCFKCKFREWGWRRHLPPPLLPPFLYVSVLRGQDNKRGGPVYRGC